MKKINKKKIIIVILITILIIAIVFVVIALRNKRDVDNYSENITDENDANIINQIKAEINSTADTNIYQVEDEYDGRHTLQIKPNIQFDTVLAGVLIEGTPANNEIDSILENKPTNTGVWISKKSRDSFEKILIDNNLTNFSIDESGYLFETEKKNNEMSKKLDNIIKILETLKEIKLPPSQIVIPICVLIFVINWTFAFGTIVCLLSEQDKQEKLKKNKKTKE